MMVVQEAGDITDNQPIIYLSQDSQRRQEREKALQAQWQAGHFNLQLLHAEIWALMAGTGFIQCSYRPELYSGRGGIKLTAWSPENVLVDPWCSNHHDWEYLILRVRMTYDEIRRRFTRFGWKLRPTEGVTPHISNQMGHGSSQGGMFDTMQLPPGPLRTVKVPGAGQAAPQGNPVVDFVFLHDDSRVKVEPVGKDEKTFFPAPITVPKYPRGRLQVWGEQFLLYDGPNPYRKFPLVPLHAMPPITGFWAPPPIRYVLPFQQLAETMTSQTVENAIRLNNGIMVIQKSTGLTRDKVRGLPGEILEVDNVQGQGVYFLTPPPFPDQMVNLPDKFIMRMRELFGFSPERAGKVAQGNISSSLMDAAIEQSEKLMKLRARYYAEAVQDVAELVFGTMLDYLGDTALPMVEPNSFITTNVPWAGALPDELEGWDVLVDPNSVMPVAQQARKKMALLLRNLASIDQDTLLKWLDAPERDDIVRKTREEQALMAASRDQSKMKSRTNR
jgi:hypothetical protein